MFCDGLHVFSDANIHVYGMVRFPYGQDYKYLFDPNITNAFNFVITYILVVTYNVT